MDLEELVWLEPPSPVGDEEIAKVEKELEVIFPDGYRALLRKSQGGMPAQTDFKLRDPRKTTAAVGMFLSTAPGRDSDYIVSAAKILSDRLPPAVVPVAIGPGGDYVVLDLREARLFQTASPASSGNCMNQMPKPRLSWIDVAWTGNPEKVVGFAVTVRGLSPASSLRLQTLGLGGRRHLGCGLLLPTAARELQGASEL